jgi:hypothetical protein
LQPLEIALRGREDAQPLSRREREPLAKLSQIEPDGR